METYQDLENNLEMKDNINKMVDYCYNQAKNAGWHNKPREVGTDLMLITSEIAEAMEGARKNLMDSHLKNRKMFDSNNILTFANMSKRQVTIFVQKANVQGYDITVSEWYAYLGSDVQIPSF